MKFEIHYKDGTWELIRANSLTEAISKSLMEEYIVKIEVLR